MFELKINNINVDPDTVSFTASLYNTGELQTNVDPVSGDIKKTYPRTLLITRDYSLSRPIDRSAILQYLRNRMDEYNAAHGSNYQPSDFYINISKEASGID